MYFPLFYMDPLYMLVLIAGILLSIIPQRMITSTYAKYSAVDVKTGLSGQQVAREILDRNGLQDIPIFSTQGALSDHYDPHKKAVFLSQDIFYGKSVSATAVAAHEVGHAIQDANNYAFLKFRSLIFPLAQLGSQGGMILLIVGILFNLFWLTWAAIIMFALALLFQLVTLPVEFNASSRALGQIKELNLLSADEYGGAKRVLQAAAFTYVAAAIASLLQLLYYIFRFGGNNRD